MHRFIISGTVVSLALSSAFGITVRTGAGANAAVIQSVVDQFRADLGALNANVAGTQNGGLGRREINWDGVPDALSAPNNLLANFFNANSPRGAVFTNAPAFAVSSNTASGVPVRFGNIDASYSAQFQTFSPQRLFTSLGSNVYDVEFFVPGSNTPAAVRGFGSVFTDVDLANTTTIEYFDAANISLGIFAAPTFNQGLSFLGVFDTPGGIHRVRITGGNAALGAGILEAAGVDLVVADDFLYGEPTAVPTPSAAGAFVTTVGALGLRRRRR